MSHSRLQTAVRYGLVTGTASMFLSALILAACGGSSDSAAVAESDLGGQSCLSEADPPAPTAESEPPVAAGETFHLDGLSVTLPRSFEMPGAGAELAEGVTVYAPSDGRTNAFGTARYALSVFGDATAYRPHGGADDDPLAAFVSEAVPAETDGCLEYTYRDAGRARWAFRSQTDELYQHELIALADGRYVEFWMHIPLQEMARQRQTAIFDVIASSVELSPTPSDQGSP